MTIKKYQNPDGPIENQIVYDPNDIQTTDEEIKKDPSFAFTHAAVYDFSRPKTNEFFQDWGNRYQLAHPEINNVNGIVYDTLNKVPYKIKKLPGSIGGAYNYISKNIVFLKDILGDLGVKEVYPNGFISESILPRETFNHEYTHAMEDAGKLKLSPEERKTLRKGYNMKQIGHPFYTAMHRNKENRAINSEIASQISGANNNITGENFNNLINNMSDEDLANYIKSYSLPRFGSYNIDRDLYNKTKAYKNFRDFKNNAEVYGEPAKNLSRKEARRAYRNNKYNYELNKEKLDAVRDSLINIRKDGGFLPRIQYGKSGIHIKPENEGKFTATKERTGKTTEELTHSKNPLTRKRAIFAQNAAKWNHK